jgi:hypothetical protein
MTHDMHTYQAGRRVRVRVVRGVRSMTVRCDKRRTLRARGPHRRIEQAQHAGEQARCMTHDMHTYQAGRQVRVRAVRGELQRDSMLTKGKNSEHVDRTGALSEGRIRRAVKVHHTR